MKITKHIPNTITCCNLLSGAMSIIFTFKGEYQYAVYCILLASVFDFFDGFSARLLKAYSGIGKELDSLADVISFGLAPSILLYHFHNSMYAGTPYALLSYVPLLLAALSAVRLAKFNLDERQTTSFIGLPTPAAAILFASLIYYLSLPSTPLDHWAYQIILSPFYLPVAAVIIAILLLVEIPMFSLKLKSFKWEENKTTFTFFGINAVSLIIIIILQENWSLWLALLFKLYILFNIVLFLIPRKK